MSKIPLLVQSIIRAARAEARRTGKPLQKKVRQPRRARHPYALESELFKLILAIYREWFKDLETKVLLDYEYNVKVVQHNRPDVKQDDFNDDVKKVFIALLLIWQLNITRIGPALRDLYNRLNLYSQNTMNEVTKSAIGVKVYLHEPWLQDEMKAATKEAVALIKDIGDDTARRVETIITNGVLRGTSIDEIKQSLKDEMKIGENRAALIAVDQVGKFNANLTRLRANAMGIDDYIWHDMGDNRVRPLHRSYSGNKYSFSNPPADGNPGEPIQCIPGDSHLNNGCGVEKLYRRGYTGKLTELVTKTGETLRATSNHPVLTQRGWVAIEDVNLGDYIFKSVNNGVNIFSTSEGNIQNAKPTFTEIFDTVAKFTPPIRYGGTREQFHGDGVINEDVYIIDTTRGLPSNFEILLDKEICQNFFTYANRFLDDSFLPTDRSTLHVFNTLWPTPDSIVRGASKLLSLFGCESTHSDEVRLTAVSGLYAGIQKSSSDNTSVHTILFGYKKLTEAGYIISNDVVVRKIFAIMRFISSNISFKSSAFDKFTSMSAADTKFTSNITDMDTFSIKPYCVVHKSFSDFSAQVYNLQTTTGWYVSQDYIIKNCRCTADLVFGDDYVNLLAENPRDWDKIGPTPY